MELPKSTATNAYELLDEVKALILAEPRRYNQRTWVALGKHGPDYNGAPMGFPACGTVCCIAGWIVMLKHGLDFYALETPDIACDILGVDEDAAMRLFSADGFIVDGFPQTLAHAESGAAHITYFQHAHAAQLKAKAV